MFSKKKADNIPFVRENLKKKNEPKQQLNTEHIESPPLK